MPGAGNLFGDRSHRDSNELIDAPDQDVDVQPEVEVEPRVVNSAQAKQAEAARGERGDVAREELRRRVFTDGTAPPAPPPGRRQFTGGDDSDVPAAADAPAAPAGEEDDGEAAALADHAWSSIAAAPPPPPARSAAPEPGVDSWVAPRHGKNEPRNP